MITTPSASNDTSNVRTLHRDHGYDEFSRLIAARIAATAGPLFTTDATSLWETYLGTLPVEDQQGYNCNACRRFFETYGGLVTIDETGCTKSLLWSDNVPDFFRVAVARLHLTVNCANVTGVFLTTAKVWGQPVTGFWRHLHGVPTFPLYKSTPLLNESQAMAEKVQDYGSLSRGLGEYAEEHVETAVALLSAETLYRSEKVLGPAQFLLDLHRARATTRDQRRRNNLVWRAVATAPAGFAHPKTTMVSTLLDDLVAGVSLDTAKQKFAAKMNPLQYQRPQAAPTAGQVMAAEKLAESLNLGPALRRRFARLEEVDAIWRPKEAASAKAGGPSGVFSHLLATPAKSAGTITHPSPMTWAKFESTVLPNAESIAARVPSHGLFIGLLTAVDPNARPILQWDREDRRNPFSHYVYSNGSPASQWRLTGGAMAKVTAITRMPHQWYGGGLPNQKNGAILILDGAQDTNGPGLCLFPEILKSELHGVRSVIEAHSRATKAEGAGEASACGLDLRVLSGASPVVLHVTSKGVTTIYTIDRLD